MQEQLARGPARFVVAGRALPFDPAWLVGAHHLAHWRSDRLAFDLEEGAALLPGIGRRQLARWQRRLEGWPLAFGLLASLPAGDELPPALGERLIPYLAGRVFNLLPAELVHFLQVTAAPLRFNDELAGYLLASGDAAAMRAEIQRRNLFLYPDEEPGWYRYHELIRSFLCARAGAETAALLRRTVAWLVEQDELEQAVEHALAGGLTATAAELLARLPFLSVMQAGRYLTYRRWVLSLEEQDRARWPVLVARLGLYLHHSDTYRAEGWKYLRAGLDRAQEAGDPAARIEALRHLATAHHAEGRYDQAAEILRGLAGDPACSGNARLSAVHNLAVMEAYQAQFAAAGRHFEEALRLAGALESERDVNICRLNLATLLLIPRGRLAEAARILDAIATVYGDLPHARLTYLTQRADLESAEGAWAALEQTVADAERAYEALETPVPHLGHLVEHYRALASAAMGRSPADSGGTGEIEAFPIAFLLQAAGQAWRLRQQGLAGEAIDVAAAALSRPLQLPYYCARLSLELDLARVAARAGSQEEAFVLGPETRRLIAHRARADLVRLRMLLTIVCWQAGDPRWQRHARAALFASYRPRYEMLLTARDPDLAVRFWKILLVEEVAGDRAEAALAEIGRPADVAPLLEETNAAVRARAAALLARMGDEQAIPHLAGALASEREPAARQALEAALAHLESLPPPPLTLQLMGGFSLRRGETDVPPGAFHRPVVLRLLHYFALHRGRPLARDRILEDLWPDAEPEKAYNTFRSVYSRLRAVLEPHMRPNGPNRYFAAEGDVYRFDPAGRVTVDAEQAQELVEGVLASAAAAAVPPLPEAFLQALSNWQPLLPELPYEEWLLMPRETLQETFVNGCVYAARAFLAHDRPAEAAGWAQQAVEAAPWLEEAYQSLMRAYARQGDRARALRVYQVACEALRRELNIAPSALTEWLAGRLQRGEPI